MANRPHCIFQQERVRLVGISKMLMMMIVLPRMVILATTAMEKDGHDSGHSDHGHNSDGKNGDETGHIHGEHSDNGYGKECNKPGHVHGESVHKDGKGSHEQEHSDGGSGSKGDLGHKIDKDHSAEHQEDEAAGGGHKSA